MNIFQYCDAVTDLGLTEAVVWGGGGYQYSSYCLPMTSFRVRGKSGAGSASRELDPEEMFRINVFLLILDRIYTELDKMSNVYKKCPSQVWIWLKLRTLEETPSNQNVKSLLNCINMIF